MTPGTLLRAWRGLSGQPFANREALREYQSTCLRALVQHAHRNVPFYRRKMSLAGVSPGDIRSVNDLHALPLCSRAEMQSLDANDCASGLLRRGNHIERTSGSSGTPLTIRRSWAEQNLMLAFRMQAFKQWGFNWSMRRVVIDHFNETMRLAAGRPRLYEKVGLLPRLVLDWQSPKEELVKRICSFHPDSIGGAPTLIADFARKLNDLDRQKLGSARVVFTGSEQLTDADRLAIESGFGLPVIDVYGSSEVVFIGAQTPGESGYKICDESVIVEVLKDGQPSDQGELFVTGLHLWSMPFIRYSLGDYVSLLKHPGPNTWLASIDGRENDRFTLPDGREIHGYLVGECIENCSLAVKRFQVVQRQTDQFQVRLVVESGNRLGIMELRDAIRKVVGKACQVDIDLVDFLERPRRKFYPFVSYERYVANLD
jgi:phenylacetate-CoA ligase